MIDASMKCIAWNGRLLVVGFAGGHIEKVAMNKVLLKNISIVGVRPITFTDQSFEGLESVPRELKALEERGTWGKVVVRRGEEEGEEARSRL